MTFLSQNSVQSVDNLVELVDNSLISLEMSVIMSLFNDQAKCFYDTNLEF